MKLVKIAAVGGIATATMGLLYKFKVTENVKQSEQYREALKLLRSNKAAVNLLGEPIKDLNVEVGDTTRNYTKDNKSRYEVPLRGSKERGRLYFWAEKESDKWIVKRMELEVGKDDSKRLLLKQI